MVENVGQSIYWLNEKIYVTLDPIPISINPKLLEKKIWVSSFCLRNARKRDTKNTRVLLMPAFLKRKFRSFYQPTYIAHIDNFFFFLLTRNKQTTYLDARAGKNLACLLKYWHRSWEQVDWKGIVGNMTLNQFKWDHRDNNYWQYTDAEKRSFNDTNYLLLENNAPSHDVLCWLHEWQIFWSCLNNNDVAQANHMVHFLRP